MTTSLQAVDLVLFARYVIPVVPANAVLQDHAIVIQAGRLVDLLPRAEVAAKYEPAVTKALDDHILIPGLVNAHTHTAMTLMRGLSDDKTLGDWLVEDIWPAEAKFLSPEYVHDGVLHAAAEMLRSGTTCCSDMYFFPDAAAKALTSAGMRAALGQVVFEFPTAYAGSADDYLAKARAMLDEYKEHELISSTIAPHAPYTVSDDVLTKVKALAETYDVPIHTHLHETQAECDASEHLERSSMNCHLSDHKLRPLANFQRLGLLSSRLVAAHMTQLTDAEIDQVAASGMHVVHCPTSNLKLASGLCPVSKLLAKGVNVAIGTDGAASHNSLDMMQEMKLAAILAKAESGQSTSVPAATALAMATLHGAKALGLDAQIGSIEIGKRADLVAIACDSIEMMPMYCPISHVVYVAGRENVSDVWVNGQQVLEQRQLRTIDEHDVKARVQTWFHRIRDYHDALQLKKEQN